jgi:oxaloacetate decarboxylase alpha subunit
MVEIFHGTPYDTGLEVKLLVEIAAYFREVRKKYAKFESSFLGADTRILVAQVPGGMLSNMESQLKEQGAADKIDAVLKEIPIVQKDAGFVPLVTPTSQIVGTQAVFNVLQGRYNNLTGEFRDLLVGKYGKTPAPCNPELVKKALAESKMEAAITHRPADDIPNEFAKLEEETKKLLGASKVSVEDVLTYAMFPKVAPGFFQKRAEGPVKMEAEPAPAPAAKSAAPAAKSESGSYVVTVNGTEYSVLVRPEGTVAVKPQERHASQIVPGGTLVEAPVAGVVLRLVKRDGDAVKKGETILIVESMKMELEIKSTADGKVKFLVQAGANIAAHEPIAELL